MLHVRLAQAFQSGLRYSPCEAEEPCLHIGRKLGNLSSDSLIQDFDRPMHNLLYLIFEIIKANLSHVFPRYAFAPALADLFNSFQSFSVWSA
jgi:hypothetical protein